MIEEESSPVLKIAWMYQYEDTTTTLKTAKGQLQWPVTAVETHGQTEQ